LVEENLADGLLDAVTDALGIAGAHRGGDFLEIEERQGLGGHLLGTAIGVAVERGEDARRIEAGDGAKCERGLARAGNESVEDVGVEGEVLAGGQRELALARDFGIVGLNRDGQGLDQLLACRSGQRDLDGGDAFAIGSVQRNRQSGLGLVGKVDAGGGLAERQAIGRHVEAHAAGGAGGVDNFKPECRCVARGKEARHRGGDDDRVTDENVLIGLAHGGLGPCDGHQFYRAVEAGQGEFGAGVAIRTNLDRAREVGHQFLGRWGGFELGPACVAAGAHGAHCAVLAIDQAAIDVAYRHAEFLLAEIVAFRVRRSVGGKVEDADIDGSERDEGLFASRDAIDLDRHGQRAARVGFGRGLDGRRPACALRGRQAHRTGRAHGMACGQRPRPSGAGPRR
jgi:hypothetical protein